MEIEYEHRLTGVEERSRSNTKRLDAVEKRQDDLEKLVSTVAVLVEKMQSLENNIVEIKQDVKTLKGKPAKQWEQLTGQIVTLVVAALVGFILAKLGI